MQATNDQEPFLAALSESITDMQDYLLRLADGCEQITFMMQTGNAGEALEYLSQAIEGLTYLTTLIDTAKILLKLDYTTLCIEKGVTVDLFIKEWERLCHELSQASMQKDYSLLGDLVDYDLTELVKQARSLMLVFQQYVPESKVV